MSIEAVATYTIVAYSDGSAELTLVQKGESTTQEFSKFGGGGAMSADGELTHMTFQLSSDIERMSTTDWVFKTDAEPLSCSDGWDYGLRNGYVDLSQVLALPDQLEIAKTAVADLSGLYDALEEAELWEEM